MDRTADREHAIAIVVADIRAIELRDGVSRSSLESIKQRLMKRAARQELFSTADYPLPFRPPR